MGFEAGVFLMETAEEIHHSKDQRLDHLALDGVVQVRDQLSQGATVKALQAQLGHRDPSLTLRVYPHLYGDEHNELARRLDAAYGAGVSQVCPTAEPTPLRRAVDVS